MAIFLHRTDSHRVRRTGSVTNNEVSFEDGLTKRMADGQSRRLTKGSLTSVKAIGDAKSEITHEEPGMWDFDQQTSSEPPSDFFEKVKYYYKRYNINSIIPFLVLIIFSWLGALMFHWVEHDYEQELYRLEHMELEHLRNTTFLKLNQMKLDSNVDETEKLHLVRNILIGHEEQLKRLKLPDNLEWDIWGALYYVGTIFTTIGYGNIAPRTVEGKVLSIAYALFGIPLVLAILNHFGNTLTEFVSNFWLRYRRLIKRFKKTSVSEEPVLENSSQKLFGKQDDIDVEKGIVSDRSKVNSLRPPENHDEEDGELNEIEESRTIPLWLAIFSCLGWICFSSGLFCLWEERWTYFTSFYFFFISLSTIGLGDVVPDHPRMLILMFWLVIIGLSIVSMLLNVIRIKIEEWLYNLMIRIRKEYQRALESGDPVERKAIMKKLLKKQPWFMRNLAPSLMTANQAEKFNFQVRNLEKSVSSTNNKNIQTDMPVSKCNSPIFKTEDTDHTSEYEYPSELPNDATASDSFISDSADAKILSVPQQLLTADTCEKIRNNSAAQTAPIIPKDCEVQTDVVKLEIEEILDKYNTWQQMINSEAKTNDASIVDQSVCTASCVTDESSLSAATEPVDQMIQCNLKDLSMTKSMVLSIPCAEKHEKATNVDAHQFQTRRSIGTDPLIIPEYSQDAHTFLESKNTCTEFMCKFAQTEIVTYESSATETDPWIKIISTPECTRAAQTEMLGNPVEHATQTDVHELISYAMMTDPWLAMELQSDCTLAVQANASDAEVIESIKLDEFVEQPLLLDYGLQCSVIVANKLSQTSFELDESFGKPARKDLITQTDNSYLKIARRLDEMRSNRTNSLHVCAAKPIGTSKQLNVANNSFVTDRPLEEPGLHDSPKPQTLADDERNNIQNWTVTFSPVVVEGKFKPKQKREALKGGESSAESSMQATMQRERGLPKIKSDENHAKRHDVLKLKSSKVGEYIKQHEIGDHSPGTWKKSKRFSSTKRS